MDAFLRELHAAGAADLNALFSTLNESGLCREALTYWIGRRWICVAPHSPLLALRGPELHRGVGLHQFCGGPAPLEEQWDPASPDPAVKGESTSHEHS